MRWIWLFVAVAMWLAAQLPARSWAQQADSGILEDLYNSEGGEAAPVVCQVLGMAPRPDIHQAVSLASTSDLLWTFTSGALDEVEACYQVPIGQGSHFKQAAGECARPFPGRAATGR